MSFFSMIKLLFPAALKAPATIRVPFDKKEPWSRSRGEIRNDIGSCIFCGICSKKCVADAIRVNKADSTWEIDRLRCVQCGYCTDVCPKKCLTMVNTPPPSYEVGEKSMDKYENARVPDNTTDNKNS